MDIVHLQHGEQLYPPSLAEFLSSDAPKTLTALGNVQLLKEKAVALFCSVKCSGDIILRTYDLACALREAGIAVIGGFHSPMEKECLNLLLRGYQPVIVCAARSIEPMRVPPAWEKPLLDERLLLLSGFSPGNRRITTDLARQRNNLVAALADKIFVAHAAPGSKTEQFCRTVVSWGKPLLTLESPENGGLVGLGAEPVKPNQLDRLVN